MKKLPLKCCIISLSLFSVATNVHGQQRISDGTASSAINANALLDL